MEKRKRNLQKKFVFFFLYRVTEWEALILSRDHSKALKIAQDHQQNAENEAHCVFFLTELNSN